MFPDWHTFCRNCHNMSVCFAYGLQIDSIHALSSIIHLGKLSLRNNLNETQDSDFYGVMFSIVCIS